MAIERVSELESPPGQGRISMREFVRGLVKRDFNNDRLFSAVAPHRGIEPVYEHLLGRPPLNQQGVTTTIAIQAQQGIEARVDHLLIRLNPARCLAMTPFPTDGLGLPPAACQ